MVDYNAKKGLFIEIAERLSVPRKGFQVTKPKMLNEP